MNIGPLVVEWPESDATDPMKIVEALTKARSQARSQAIDDCIKVVREELVQQEDMSGCDETFSRRQLEKYRFAADRLSVIASRLEALKDTKEKEAG